MATPAARPGPADDFQAFDDSTAAGHHILDDQHPLARGERKAAAKDERVVFLLAKM